MGATLLLGRNAEACSICGRVELAERREKMQLIGRCRDRRDRFGKILPLIGDRKPASRTEDAGWTTVAGSDPKSHRAFWPRKTGTNRGRSRPRCGFSRVRIVLGFSLRVLTLQQLAALWP